MLTAWGTVANRAQGYSVFLCQTLRHVATASGELFDYKD